MGAAPGIARRGRCPYRVQTYPFPGGPTRFITLCTTGVLVVLLLSMADLPDPTRLLAGTAEAVVAKMRDMAAANRLMMCVVFMIWISLVGRRPRLDSSSRT